MSVRIFQVCAFNLPAVFDCWWLDAAFICEPRSLDEGACAAANQSAVEPAQSKSLRQLTAAKPPHSWATPCPQIRNKSITGRDVVRNVPDPIWAGDYAVPPNLNCPCDRRSNFSERGNPRPLFSFRNYLSSAMNPACSKC